MWRPKTLVELLIKFLALNPQDNPLLEYTNGTEYARFEHVTQTGYPHLKHPNQQIRLLHLLPEEDKPLRCHFSVALLEDEPKYNALSYVWGESSPEDNFTISCDNENLPITSNLHAFLQQHRNAVHVVPLWIDALCIDQDNEAEKSEQISIMGKVYSQANNVLIWLGKEDNDTVAVLEHASKLKRANEIIEQHNLTLDRETILFFITHADIPAYDKPVWKALNDFLRRPYFKRVWVLQEETLAQSKVYFCGKYHWIGNELIAAVLSWLKAYQSDVFTSVKASVEDPAFSEVVVRIDWDAFEKSMERELTAADATDRLHEAASDEEGIDAYNTAFANDPDSIMDDYFRISQRIHLPPSLTQQMSLFAGSGKVIMKGESLVSLLRISRRRDASVPKDRVFALLGIADEADSDKYGKDALSLPYSLDTDETFRRTTLYLIKHHQSLEVLKMVEYLPGFVNYSLSWVPRWDVKEFARANILSEVEDETGFCADGGIPLTLEEAEDAILLSVHGQRVDRVIAVSGILSQYELYYGDQLESMNIFDVWADFEKKIRPMYGMASYPTGDDLRKVFAITVIAGLGEDGRPASNDFWKHFLYQYAVESEDRLQNKGFERRWRWHAGFSDLEIKLLQEEIKNGSRAQFLGAYHRAAEHRRIFLTANGYLGLGPAAMEVEDQVAVLFGSNVPYVYRDPANEELLGQGYLGPFSAEVALKMIGVKNNTDERFDPNADFYLPPYSEDERWDGALLRTTFPKVLIGHCYVHGMMHGEAVKKYLSGDEPGVVFTFS